MDENEDSKGYSLLEKTWFDVIIELRRLIGSEDPKTSMSAADILLKYFIAMGQSINQPWVPNIYPDESYQSLVEEDEDE